MASISRRATFATSSRVLSSSFFPPSFPHLLLSKEIAMPLIDMPLAQLREYQGRTPRPDDVDAFWDAGLAEMRATDPQVELVPHALKSNFAECFHLYFTGVGGARI